MELVESSSMTALILVRGTERRRDYGGWVGFKVPLRPMAHGIRGLNLPSWQKGCDAGHHVAPISKSGSPCLCLDRTKGSKRDIG